MVVIVVVKVIVMFVPIVVMMAFEETSAAKPAHDCQSENPPPHTVSNEIREHSCLRLLLRQQRQGRRHLVCQRF